MKARKLIAQRPRKRISQQWRFDKHFSINTIVSIVSMIIFIGGPVLVWGRAMEGRVQNLEAQREAKEKLETARDADTRETRVSMATRLDKMDDKLNSVQVQVAQLVVQLGTKGH